ncbi:imidazolonepropionase [Saprospiraceae bacterium]|nr:imidazolonepropionase [bacterium]MDA9358377.1 imidazolonepropionase [Saprospiraceae bacterium]HAV29582.1 imidazolonepropionase [Saprospirales bacterium]
MRTLIKNIKNIIGIIEGPQTYKKAEALSNVEMLANGYILIEDERISDYGSMVDCPDNMDQVIDATDSLVLPAWCDSHTHIVFATTREKEFEMKIKGMSYEDIAAAGGGILNSARKLKDCSEDDLYEMAKGRLEEVTQFGTGAIEIKSGYGLSLESEVKMLRVIRRLSAYSPISIKSTFLGAHAIPTEYKKRREDYINLIINKMLPKIAEEKLADYCDVFCEKGFFTVDETDRILKAAAKYGIPPKIHANQLSNSGAVQVGIANNAISVDHLEVMGDTEIEALLQSNTIPTLLPSCSYYINIPYAPARKMIEAGLGITLATDFNPGSSPSGNIPFLLSLACTKMKLTPEEAFNAVTINGAYAMQLEDEVGSITKGKLANLIITKNIPNLTYIPYMFGTNHIEKVLVRGKVM